jgi:hypothetical protein
MPLPPQFVKVVRPHRSSRAAANPVDVYTHPGLLPLRAGACLRGGNAGRAALLFVYSARLAGPPTRPQRKAQGGRATKALRGARKARRHLVGVCVPQRDLCSGEPPAARNRARVCAHATFPPTTHSSLSSAACEKPPGVPAARWHA